MILIGLGSNVDGPWGHPRETMLRALRELDGNGTELVAASRLFETSPFGMINQPTFVNAVAQIRTAMPPEALMQHLHDIERQAGRRRRLRWGPRTLDLDLLDYHGLVRRGRLKLPHPGIPERDFWLTPLMELVPRWRHPVKQQTAQKMRSILSGFTRGGVVLDKPAERDS
ncbi:2-amino-4-hydroxy-6-hydroxymethyldihydropteridine diphosphokinase [Taklimakanibacter albus]|uniref:2-amino-4-hydroxy-6-hydroxymethyldihydropteridine diphosphokinase n=1 Tax=Taklimakanibacter albus TaxID=2800327 RepID=A0ACC5R1G1_9HYPH|nr:2-amino-4-hydroxy-6-hydroxymethyldihydropteridine diphosphokinase [Aestuariivirga sp. YIM B02566]MBK1866448.1 2-amino-4-hydroxy-6-hydroxymethyldihydropteridine diphosphokinase [Aestuariivirga sp. YIM B02566]